MLNANWPFTQISEEMDRCYWLSEPSFEAFEGCDDESSVPMQVGSFKGGRAVTKGSRARLRRKLGTVFQ